MQTLGNNIGKKFALSKLLGLFTFILTAGLGLASGSVRAEQHIIPAPLAANTGAEDTERNVRDRDDKTLTPENQPESRQDLHITKTIRKAIVKQKSLSTDAHNAKIISRAGVVTLRGPVENTAEKTKLESIAKKIKGVKQVDNQLEPKTP
ncbi:BON domain-containing protein [Candidatus Methylobacter oryzae]|uniref:BON domain-containing protein n=1 Tax=Candidatus Methylobacter oryzae TaxID=2497749 RepID=A0ABY3C6S8_9GAMM|nr:BON domain-containing protein [Candidatus Methylobacter oryzae]TRW91252.1 BON domain-containing protein [Candidatus Methylobacter oryzae]